MTDHWTAETYRLLDAGDPRAWANFAPDIRVQIGNDPIANGADEAGRAFRAMSEAAPVMSHHVLSTHDLDPDRALLRADVTYHRVDGEVVTVPVATVVQRDDEGLFCDLQLYFDSSPLFVGQRAQIAIRGSVKVNPSPSEHSISRQEFWNALVDKAKHAELYVPNITECTVVESGPNWILRNIVLDGLPSQERVVFEEPDRIVFTRTRSNMVGTVMNLLDERDGDLYVSFQFDPTCQAIAEGTSLAQEIRDDMESGYLRTFAKVRDNLRRGALAPGN